MALLKEAPHRSDDATVISGDVRLAGCRRLHILLGKLGVHMIQ
jgi:hypothetical protein